MKLLKLIRRVHSVSRGECLVAHRSRAEIVAHGFHSGVQIGDIVLIPQHREQLFLFGNVPLPFRGHVLLCAHIRHRAERLVVLLILLIPLQLFRILLLLLVVLGLFFIVGSFFGFVGSENVVGEPLPEPRLWGELRLLRLRNGVKMDRPAEFQVSLLVDRQLHRILFSRREGENPAHGHLVEKFRGADVDAFQRVPNRTVLLHFEETGSARPGLFKTGIVQVDTEIGQILRHMFGNLLIGARVLLSWLVSDLLKSLREGIFNKHGCILLVFPVSALRRRRL